MTSSNLLMTLQVAMVIPGQELNCNNKMAANVIGGGGEKFLFKFLINFVLSKSQVIGQNAIKRYAVKVSQYHKFIQLKVDS